MDDVVREEGGPSEAALSLGRSDAILLELLTLLVRLRLCSEMVSEDMVLMYPLTTTAASQICS